MCAAPGGDEVKPAFALAGSPWVRRLPPGLVVDSRTPQNVSVIAPGPKRSFYFAQDDDVELTAKLFDADIRSYAVFLSAPDVRFRSAWTFVNIVPRSVTFEIRERDTEEKP